jgi:ABC-type nitrate/sulfonate/bicarbonate transport system permease component
MTGLKSNPAVRRLLRSSVTVVAGLLGSCALAWVLWVVVLVPMRWPPPGQVLRYFLASVLEPDTYCGLFATGVRAILAMVIGFCVAVVLALLTGRTRAGWMLLFFLLMAVQKIPAVAMVHVFVKSRLGLGFAMTVALAATVVTTFSWLVLHHRARTLDVKQVFALRVVGMPRRRAVLLGLVPHLGSAIGGSARLAMSIALLLVVVGEWQGTWDDGSIWRYGLGVSISRAYDAIDSQARVLSGCLWLGLLGVLLDVLVQGALVGLRRLIGVDFQR